jgi:hypothetical protein
MADPLRRRRRAEEVKARAGQTDADYQSCRIFGCGRSTRAASGGGLNRLYCRNHEDHFQRHGSYTKGTYTKAQLAPARKVVRQWLEQNRDLPLVKAAIEGARALLDTAGLAEPAFRLRGRSPQERARIAWARLRAAGVAPVKLVEAWLTVELTIAKDPQPDRHEEFKRVQAAKLVHRLASGTHKKWEHVAPDGFKVVTEMHRYPASRGRVLRHMGADLQQLADVLSAHHLADIGVNKTRLGGPASEDGERT